MTDVLIIGAGIIGSSIFRELTKFNLNVLLIDKENDVSCETTKANSAIIHAGHDPENGTSMAELNVKGSRMTESLVKDLNVPYKKNGALVIGFTEEDLKRISYLYENGLKNGVKNMKVLKNEEILKMEPNLNKNVSSALYVKDSAIIDPFDFTYALCENGVLNGGNIKVNENVVKIEKNGDFFYVYTKKGDAFKTRYIVNAAGIYSDDIHNMVCKEKFKITPRSGEYFVLDKTEGKKISHTIFTVPSKISKGILVTPTVHGNILVGPDARDTDSKYDFSTNAQGLSSVKKAALKITEKLDFKKNIRNFAGLRAVSNTGDFYICEDEETKGFIDVSGIKSPGLSSAPAIAEKVINILSDAGLDLKNKKNFNKYRDIIRFSELSDEEKDSLIKKNKEYGKIVCRCESITEGEIVDAIKRSPIRLTTDGIKRRVRPGMGRCQGGFCRPRVIDILSREYNISKDEVLKDREGSYILDGKTK
ncbi:NAD(P)/FAD-dependent oxidoreductase [Clostridium sp. BJN0001]|uniref:NAD(P)/FAD-dependent oxidoreductase n=1 Tax=Clostridium sp. BJN0001 TaxID=2930219 RepID=UPI001FD2B709|nr:NAD(P)/FAD-dependent oxidoreductase [Clostridium sp. BJN0001]